MDILKKKIKQKYFNQILDNEKNFELRKEDDCTYDKGDIVLLMEVNDNDVLTCNYILVEITQVWRNIKGLAEDYCIFQFDIIKEYLFPYKSSNDEVH